LRRDQTSSSSGPGICIARSFFAGAVAVVSIEDEVRNAINPVIDEPFMALPSSQEKDSGLLGHAAFLAFSPAVIAKKFRNAGSLTAH
jgi:hypothetical protein